MATLLILVVIALAVGHAEWRHRKTARAIAKAARAEKINHDHLQAMLTPIGDMVEAVFEKQNAKPVTAKQIVQAKGWSAIRAANERFNRDQQVERERAEENTNYEPAS